MDNYVSMEPYSKEQGCLKKISISEKMKAEETSVKDCWVLEPDVFEDERGYFYEGFNSKKFKLATGFDFEVKQIKQRPRRRSDEKIKQHTIRKRKHASRDGF